MAPLPPDLRRDLERAVVAARETAEAGAGNALAVLGVQREPAPVGLSDDDRALRVALRARARSLGNGLTFDGIPALTEEIAYAVWHRMLFARFLAENHLLVEPASGAPVSMEDVAELARSAGEPDPWVLAARYATQMLPGIFGTEDPTTRVAFSPDDRLRLETILRSLPAELFTADDALGWVYQFWQSKRKDEVNKAGRKIDGEDLSPVTQLFTEHYMVRFLLENSLGAWWAGHHPDSPLLREWEYLRYRDDGTPAAGTFEGWPARAAEITVMDPCMGSGHFLVAAADMLRRIRMEEEGLSAADAAEAVITDNLFGLELDPRCTQIGAFALAFDAWKAAGGYRELPVPNIACSGIAVKGQLDDWRRLAGTDTNLRIALGRLYELFQDAPDLGSLIDPRAAAGNDLLNVDPDRLLAALDQALAKETEDPAAAVFGAAAQGTAKAARLLSDRYWLVATNPPYLGRALQSQRLRDLADARFRDGRDDLALMFAERMRAMLTISGTQAFVAPQNWLYTVSYRDFRVAAMNLNRFAVVARLGEHSFRSSSAAGAFVALSVIERRDPENATVCLIDLVEQAGPDEKAAGLRDQAAIYIPQALLLQSRDSQVSSAALKTGKELEAYAHPTQGFFTGDNNRFLREFWEVIGGQWRSYLTAPEFPHPWTGRSELIWWPDNPDFYRERSSSRYRGVSAWGKQGVLLSRMRSLKPTIYRGELFDGSAAAVTLDDPVNLRALRAFVQSSEYVQSVREVDPNLQVSVAALTKVPFDLEHWTKVAAEQYPDGLPEPHSDDPTQWLFKGNIVGAEAPLQVAVVRLLGYRWPDQEPDALDALADPDGIVCLPAVAGDAPAHERLEGLLAAAYGPDWSNARRAVLLAGTGGKATTLDAWLRDVFFEQHARLFHNRPFIWHVWDGRKDGFSALLHYHRLDRSTLEKLTYHHLGDWLERQEADIRVGIPGADIRLKAARDLQAKLRLILEGEDPYDIYVRWKPTAQQPIGWQPDLDDGVRLNIRPFVTAGILRARFTVNWNKDRGTDPDGSERINDRNLSLAAKRAARGHR